jgi:5'-3' exonuclease
VAGVGEKTAARLIDRYGSLAGVLAALDDPESGFAPGVRAKLQASREYLRVAPDVVRVALDVAVPPVAGDLPTQTDGDRVLALAERWNIAGSASRAVDALTAAPRRP